MTVRFTETAEDDLRANLDFYQAPSSAGDGFNALVRRAVGHLATWPFTGHRRRDLTKRDVCFWTEDPFYFVVSISNDTLTIVAVLHASRNVASLLRKRLKPLRRTP